MSGTHIAWDGDAAANSTVATGKTDIAILKEGGRNWQRGCFNRRKSPSFCPHSGLPQQFFRQSLSLWPIL